MTHGRYCIAVTVPRVGAPSSFHVSTDGWPNHSGGPSLAETYPPFRVTFTLPPHGSFGWRRYKAPIRRACETSRPVASSRIAASPMGHRLAQRLGSRRTSPTGSAGSNGCSSSCLADRRPTSVGRQRSRQKYARSPPRGRRCPVLCRRIALVGCVTRRVVRVTRLAAGSSGDWRKGCRMRSSWTS